MAKPKRLKKCKNPGCPLPDRKFLPDRPFQDCCTVKCAIEYAPIKQREKEKKDARAEKKVYYHSDYRQQFKLTRQEAQKLANRLDKNLPCICCDDPPGKAQFCGGHFKTGKGHPELALDLRNIHGQRNKHCNEQKSGNIFGDKHSKGYRQGLIDRYGELLVDYLESYRQPNDFTCDSLIRLRAIYAAEVRLLKKTGKPSRNWRSLNYRITNEGLIVWN